MLQHWVTTKFILPALSSLLFSEEGADTTAHLKFPSFSYKRIRNCFRILPHSSLSICVLQFLFFSFFFVAAAVIKIPKEISFLFLSFLFAFIVSIFLLNHCNFHRHHSLTFLLYPLFFFFLLHSTEMIITFLFECHKNEWWWSVIRFEVRGMFLG